MRETKVEQRFTRRVKGLGGWAVKILPSVSGLPDRMAIMPGGRVIFVELKAPKGTVAPHQTVVHRRLASLGSPVEVLATLEAVDSWADAQALLL
jgi:hypothetical protein